MPASRCPGCNCWRSEGPCKGCAYWARRARERREGLRCHHCCVLLSEAGSRCGPCRGLRRGPDHARRQELAHVLFPQRVRDQLLARLASGEHLTDVCADLDITSNRVHGFTAYHSGWADALDGALMAGRDPELDHGTVKGYRHQRCRCPECREAKSAPPVSWRRRTPAAA